MKSIRIFSLLLIFSALISVPSYASIPTTAKGMWIWQIWNDENGNLDSIISKLKASSVTWVAEKLGDSNQPWNSPGENLYNWASRYGGFDSVIIRFHNNGINFYAWQYIYGASKWTGSGTLPTEADVTNQILDMPGVDGFIIDAEVEFEAAGMTTIAALYMDSVRAVHPNSFVALTSFARVVTQPIPWTTFLSKCDANMPQAYWALRPTDPTTEFNAMRTAFESAEQTWINQGYLSAIKPIVPIGCEGPNTGYVEKFGDIQQFCSLVQGVSYVGVSLWEYADMDTMNWRDYADSWVNSPPIVPRVTGTVPSSTNNVPAYDSIKVSFNTPMDADLVDSAFSINPSINGKLVFNPDFTQWTFMPDTLLAWSTQYTVTIDISAASLLGVHLNSPYSLKFTTVPIDTTPPYPVIVSPQNGGKSSSQAYFEFIMDKPTNYSSFVSHLSLVDSSGKKISLAKDLFQLTANNLTLAAFRSASALTPGMQYTVSVTPGVLDYYGNSSKATYSTTFTVYTSEATGGTVIENFESSPSSWMLSAVNHGTTGVDTTLTSFVVQSSKKYDGNYAGRLQYAFDTTAANAICEVENTQAYDIGNASSIEMWFFGDNSGNELDFVFGSSQEKIVSVDTINWYGWRLVGMLRDTSDVSTITFKGFAVRRLQSALLTSGSLYVDDIQVNGRVTGIKGKVVQPLSYELFQNYPNPFNPTTVISYQLSVFSHVTLKVYDVLGREVATLVNETQNPGSHTVVFDATKISSGVYICVLHAAQHVVYIKITLLK